MSAEYEAFMQKEYEEILQEMLGRVKDDVDKREGSIIYDALAPCAYYLAQQRFLLKNFINLVLPDTAVDEYLDRAIAPFAVTRKEATAAVRKMTASSPVDLETRWAIGNLVYLVEERLESGVYRVVCETAGEIGNQYSGALSSLSNVSGVTAMLTDIIEAGTDRETDDALKERLYQKVQLPATSGNAHHYKLWALEVPGVGDAKVFPLDNGPGTVTVLVVDSNKQADQTLEQTVSNHIETVRPIGAEVSIDSPSVTAVNVGANVLLDGSREMSAVQADFNAALDIYLKGLVFADYRVSYAKVGSLLLAVSGVQDYDRLTLNGASGNVIIGAKAIPTRGVATLTEVSMLGTD